MDNLVESDGKVGAQKAVGNEKEKAVEGIRRIESEDKYNTYYPLSVHGFNYQHSTCADTNVSYQRSIGRLLLHALLPAPGVALLLGVPGGFLGVGGGTSVSFLWYCCD